MFRQCFFFKRQPTSIKTTTRKASHPRFYTSINVLLASQHLIIFTRSFHFFNSHGEGLHQKTLLYMQYSTVHTAHLTNARRQPVSVFISDRFFTLLHRMVELWTASLNNKTTTQYDMLLTEAAVIT
jgi:hypothetical protein